VEVKQQYLCLLRMQELATATRQAQAVIDGAPGRIAEIEDHFRDRNTEYVELKDRSDELDQDQQQRTAEVAELEESKAKYMADLMQVQNQREYSAMLKEIDEVKAKISEHDDVVLKALEEIEELKPKLAEFADHIQQERVEVEQQRGKVEAEVQEAEQQIAEARAEREQLEQDLPVPLLNAVRRIEPQRHGLFLAKVEGGMCQACYVRVRPQALQEIKVASAVHACSQCRRFLYFEPTLKPAPPAGKSQEADSRGVEAVNGGAV